jgi:hypothetical protein
MPYFALRHFSIDSQPFRPGDRVDDCDLIPMLASHLLDSGRVELRASPPPALPLPPLAATAIPARKLAFSAPSPSSSAGSTELGFRDQIKARLKAALRAAMHRRRGRS